MYFWQQSAITVFGLIALFAFVKSFYASYYRKKAYADTPIFGILFSGFVYADNVVFGLFWFAVSFLTLFLQDWLLFLLTLSLFWLVRSIGETIYWFLQQFSPRGGNPPEKFWHFKYFHNDSVYFINQIVWQCMIVITLITSIYITHLWLP